jgi:P27 family predicted phage terminase small subunit
MRGRTPKPAALRLVDGNPGHREIPATPDVEASIPECPAHLQDPSDRASQIARQEWDRITPELLMVQLINPLFRSIVVAYCDAWGEYVFAHEMLIRPPGENGVGGGGYLVKTPNNYEVQSPWVAIKNKAQEKLTKTATELGLTPSALMRVAGNAQMPLFPESDPMEAFFRAGNRQQV